MSTLSPSLGLGPSDLNKKFLHKGFAWRKVSSHPLILRRPIVNIKGRRAHRAEKPRMTSDIREPLIPAIDRRSTIVGKATLSSHFAASASSISAAVEEDLDYMPQLKLWEKLAITFFSSSVCGAIFAFTAPRQMNIYYLLGLVFVFLGCFGLMRLILLEAHYKTKQRLEADLGDTESRFLDDERTCIHYKCLSPSNPATRGIHLYHGFGANLYSWRDVQSRLSEELSACVTSHDTPAFGLTKRPGSLKGYSLEYSGGVGRKVCENELQKSKEPGRGGEPGEESSQSDRDRLYLIGHSMGALCAAHEVVNHPEGISGVVLVAPALIAMKLKNLGDSMRSNKISKTAAKGLVAGIFGVIREILSSGVKLLPTLGLWLVQPLIVLCLRWAVRSREFWERGVKSAFFKKDLVGRTVINSYRLPQLVMGWEWGMVRFIRARLTNGREGILVRLRNAWRNDQPESLLRRFTNTVEDRNIRVLIIHGKEDMLVPFMNSEKLARIIPNCTLLEYNDCGHIPHEEMPSQFVEDLKVWIEHPNEAAT